MLFAFTGKQFDDATLLQHNLNRWLDPSLGQWLSEDSIGFSAGDENVRRYVGNFTTASIDPSGLESQDPAADPNRPRSTLPPLLPPDESKPPKIPWKKIPEFLPEEWKEEWEDKKKEIEDKIDEWKKKLDGWRKKLPNGGGNNGTPNPTPKFPLPKWKIPRIPDNSDDPIEFPFEWELPPIYEWKKYMPDWLRDLI